ncbi:pimeloyl-ACP methyl ester carboxylesterase [Streptacidiphilus sp. MAP12-33]|uniref:alpha/beta fold hydrolase n=1 Tax=Streptacidiphilus sp. MAP12-33 TaxID=3156266 RepID=UPI003511B6E6
MTANDRTSGTGGGRRTSELRVRHRVIHGHRIAFRMAGKGPVLLLIHGIGDTSDTWADVLPGLAQHYRVVVPDLLGHGSSARPRADYSVPGFANCMRDLISVLGIERATLVGHSLGGGVAMQFAYQFPERCERLVLVGTGGVGRQVTPLLRAATLPGAGALLAALRVPGMHLPFQVGVRLMQLFDFGLGLDAPDLLRVVDALPDGSARSAFVRTLRSVVDWRGQVDTLMDRCYLTQGMPTLLVWGDRDQVVPAAHAGLAHMSMPGSRLAVFENTGHFPFRSDPQRFVNLVHEFVRDTEPASFSPEEWRAMLRTRRPHARGEERRARLHAVG